MPLPGVPWKEPQGPGDRGKDGPLVGDGGAETEGPRSHGGALGVARWEGGRSQTPTECPAHLGPSSETGGGPRTTATTDTTAEREGKGKEVPQTLQDPGRYRKVQKLRLENKNICLHEIINFRVLKK